ncbi:MAG: FAD-dependent oxidoreductase, partial [Trichococcus sp.]
DIRVGTRAYTSDFSPFFGSVPGLQNCFAASGLGSSGLTSGPLIGYLLPNWRKAKKAAYRPRIIRSLLTSNRPVARKT